MDLNQINPVLLLATLTQQIVEQEKELAEQKDSAEHSSVKASLSENLLIAKKECVKGELTGEFKAEGREHCR